MDPASIIGVTGADQSTSPLEDARKSSVPSVTLGQTTESIKDTETNRSTPSFNASRTPSLPTSEPLSISSPQPHDMVTPSILGRSSSLKADSGSIRHAVDTRTYAQSSLAHNSTYPPAQQRPATSSSHPVSIDTDTIASSIATTPAHATVQGLIDGQDALTSAASSPGLFTPVSSPFRYDFDRIESIEPLSSPFLHHTHRQAPKETHFAEVDVDPVSGRKIVNHYEIISELGRGVHGKVKLGRDLHSGSFVAIKIVDRVSKRKRLGRTGDQETKIKREIAILKKARHPNIVGLLEVIDDPLKKKVYIILEHAELGEVEWRTRGEPEVCYVEYRKNQRESDGVFDNEAEDRHDQHILETAHRHLERQERRDWEEAQQKLEDGRPPDVGPWSLEHGNESDIDPQSPVRGRYAPTTNPLRSDARQESTSGASHANAMPLTPLAQLFTSSYGKGSNSRQPFDALSTAEVQASILDDLENNMFGTYETHSPQDHPSSAFDSFVSSRNEYLADRVPEHYSYVPTMSLTEIRRAIRDTMLGLEYLHYQGVVHRDIKPANLLQTKDHRVKISDFGVSYLGKATGDPMEDPSDTEDQDFDEALELAKTVGTPAFYAPELCRLDMDEENPAPVTNQIDIWAVGVTLYCLVFGRVPFHHDNTFALMRLIAERDLYIPTRRLQAVDIPREAHEMLQSPQSQTRQFTDPSKRAPHDLVYEEVSEELRDLLKRLLTKDPRRRIKLTEVKHHPWLLTDILDPIKWLDESDPTVLTQGKPIEISQEDVDVAVIPYGISERAKNIAYRVKRKVVDVLGYGKGTSRRRAKSSAAGTGRSSNASSSSTISQDGKRQEDRRQSLRPDEALLMALRASREPDHPLSRSVTASPEPDDEAAETLEDLTASRPDVLERGISATGSVRTIRQRDVAFLSNSGAATAPALPSTPNLTERPPKSSDGIPDTSRTKETFGNTMRNLRDIREPHINASTFLRLSHEDTHSLPSVAISEAIAAGLVQPPRSLREKDSVAKVMPMSSSSSRTPSVSGPHDSIRSGDKHDLPSRNSSVSSMSSRGRSSLRSRYHPHQPHSTSIDIEPASRSPARQKVSLPQLDADIIAKAKEEQLRRLIQEERLHQASASSVPSPVSLAPCPPSPDDLEFNKYQNELLSDNAITSSTINHRLHETTPMAAYDSDEQFLPGMSQSTSNPSIPSALSANSSIGNDEMALFGAPSTRKTSSWEDSQTEGVRPQFRELSPHYEESPLIVGQDDDYSSEEEFLEMSSNRKPRGNKQRGRSKSQLNQSSEVSVRHSLDISPKRAVSDQTSQHNQA